MPAYVGQAREGLAIARDLEGVPPEERKKYAIAEFEYIGAVVIASPSESRGAAAMIVVGLRGLVDLDAMSVASALAGFALPDTTGDMAAAMRDPIPRVWPSSARRWRKVRP